MSLWKKSRRKFLQKLAVLPGEASVRDVLPEERDFQLHIRVVTGI